MTKKEISFYNISYLKQTTVLFGILTSLFGGMITGIIAVSNFKNYEKPYLFAFTFGLVGLIIGIIAAKKLKAYIVLNPKMLENYDVTTMFISTGFIGVSLLIAQKANNSYLSTIEKCDKFYVTDKYFKKETRKRSESNILVINVDGNMHKIDVHPKYFQKVKIGEKISACLYKSKIGFDYLILTNEKIDL